MASGFSWTGGRSRCFTYWQEFQKCYAQADVPSECQAQNADYLECLHHPKEIQRAQAIKAEYNRQLQHQHESKAHSNAAVPAPSNQGAPEKSEAEKK